MEPKSEVGWMKLFHPRGPQVTLPVADVTPAGSLAAVAAYLDAGWLVTAPGLEDGEEKDTVGWVLRGTFEKEGEATPFVLLYSTNDALKWSFLKVYLNTDDDIAAFEHASRMKLEAIPEYVGADKPARGASGKTDRFILAAPRPFGVVYRKNPKHDPATEEGKLKPARLFVRWTDQRPAAEADGPAAVYERAIRQSLTLDSLKQAFADAYQDNTLTRPELDRLTALKDERKAAIGGGLYRGNSQNTTALKG
jgi:hypothetical protein